MINMESAIGIGAKFIERAPKGGGNCARRVSTAILHDFEMSERLKHLGQDTIKGKTSENIIMKFAKSLTKSCTPKKLSVDVMNIAKIEKNPQTAKKLKNLVINADSTAELYKDDSKADLLKNMLNSAALKDYMPLCMSRKLIP